MEGKIEAGEFSKWVNDFIYTMKGEGGGNVPCGECVGCCTSSKFIHIRPTDVEAIKIIPKELMFTTPDLPKGHFVLGYDHNGHCPMFSNGKCSIYESRPETCKQYDCRVLTAAGASTLNEGERISHRVAAWEFQISSQESRDLEKAIKLAVNFLKEYAELFPNGYLPQSIPQLSAFAIRIHSEFVELNSEFAKRKAAELVNAIVQKY